MPGCKSGESTDELPEVFDWRKEHPECEQAQVKQPEDCGAAYVYSTLSTMQDHICQATSHTVQLSGQELLDCAKGARGCKGGSVN